jgi:hypothetical protein
MRLHAITCLSNKGDKRKRVQCGGIYLGNEPIGLLRGEVEMPLQKCGKLPGNPFIDANSRLEFPDADALRGLMSNIDIAGT